MMFLSLRHLLARKKQSTLILLGITIGTAPIEDFFYAIAASVIVPTIWMKLSFKKEQKKS